ncbi:hypothetical protein PoB_001257500 [Plakobranchus ocellatus]|uniref:Uncharacterized protein n=1 Tax=Plakobranchus ocellatus TaxID=259542 RepID=A0AAV3YTF9_9GAST|nr:hypothetical protein PoB_001257500 [Plakobranchus ocellatus]
MCLSNSRKVTFNYNEIIKLLLDLTTTTWLEHRKNHAAAADDYDADQFDGDEDGNYKDDDDNGDNDDDDGNDD